MAGRVLGTTDYVSPEQALGQPVTGQSDLYSLGVVLYEMLTGEVPFRGESPVAVAMRHVREEVPDVQLLRPERLRGHRRGARPRGRQGPRRPLPRRRQHGRRPRGGARDRGLPLGPGHRRGHDRAAHAARHRAPAPALAHAPPRALGRARWRWSASLVAIALIAAARDTRTAARASPPGVDSPRRASNPSLLAQTAAHDYNPFGTGPGKPRPDRQRGRQRPEHDVEHRAVLRRHAQEAGRGGRRAVPGRLSRRGRQGDRDPDAHAGLRGADLRRRHKSTSSLPYGDSTTLAERAAGRGRSARAASSRTANASRSSAGGQRFRYYLIWITTLPPNMESASIAELTLFK